MLEERSKKRGGLGRWLFLCVLAIAAAALFGGAAGSDKRGEALGDIALSLMIILFPSKRRVFSDIPIPVSVFIATEGYGITAASLAGGFLGLALAAVGELILNPADEKENRSKLKILASVSYAAIGVIGLCSI
jgi:hypothetical protein